VKYILLSVAILLAGCVDEPNRRVLTYTELYDYPVDCDRSREQLAELHYSQKVKNFPEDPELIRTELDRAYNSRLKATIWWFAYSCNQ
jgi:hypothetical protein